jgi:hypothetical protein
VVVFDSEESAQALMGMLGSAPAMSVTIEDAGVGEVIAHA